MAERPGVPLDPATIRSFRWWVRVVVVALITAEIAATRPSPGIHGRGLAILVTLVITVGAQVASPVAQDRVVPARIFVEMLASGILVGLDPGASAVLLLLAGLDAAASLPLGQGVYAVALAAATEILATLTVSGQASNDLLALTALGGFLLGTTIRQYQLRAEQAELRLADFERAEIERGRAVQMAERANAAREIHDILAHNLGALVMQLDAVNAMLDGEHPNLDSLRPILREAHQHAVDGLVEARQAVSSLREDTEPFEMSLHNLVENSSTASLEITGVPRPVPHDASLVVHRTAQEALTNAAKHAPGAKPVVSLDFQPSSIVLTVTDTGRPPGVPPSFLAESGGGYGLEGMRERAELIGARLTIPDRTIQP